MGTGALSELLVYDTELGQWERVHTDTRPPARYGHSALFLSDENMYVYGGQSSESEVLGDLWRFKPSTREWVEIENTQFTNGINAYTIWPPSRSGHSAAGVLGQGWQAGGAVR